MKKRTLHISKKAVAIILVIALLFGLLLVLEKTRTTNLIKLPGKTAPTSDGPTPEQIQQEAEVNAADKQKYVESNNQTTASGTASSSSKSIDLSAKQEGDSSVTVFTKAFGYGDGTCTLVATNQSRKTNLDAALIYQPEYSSCAGFSVPIDSLGKGTWNLKLSITSSGSTTDKSISYEVK